MGIQDFSPQVQQAVNRFNCPDEVRALVRAVRDQGYHSISMDLIYGLPLQTRASIAQTLEQVIELAPDRLSLFNYAHLPGRFKSQRMIQTDQLPSAQEKLAILQMAIERLQTAGYVYIGMDHFARPRDSLVQAQQWGQLQRNFQGYSTHGDCDLLAFGASSISYYGGHYIQNEKKIEAYQARVDSGQPASVRGFALSGEDHLRREVINQLICHFRLDYRLLRQRYGIEPARHFSHELEQLVPMADDGLVSLSESGIQVLSAGRLLIRRICMVFDQYLTAEAGTRYSKVI